MLTEFDIEYWGNLLLLHYPGKHYAPNGQFVILGKTVRQHILNVKRTTSFSVKLR